MRRAHALATALVLLCALSLPAAAAVAEKVHCAHCGMMVDQASLFSARIVADGKEIWFCDIGDMVLYLREKKMDPALAQVKDYPSGVWIAASQASYASDSKKFRTPMGWGLAAFQKRAEASAYGDTDDLASILKRIQ
jgi:nitrous oxide reductase accessory protein NosL